MHKYEDIKEEGHVPADLISFETRLLPKPFRGNLSDHSEARSASYPPLMKIIQQQVPLIKQYAE
jgi:hypothetical protein